MLEQGSIDVCTTTTRHPAAENCSVSHSLTLRTMLLMASAKKRFPAASNAMPKGWPTHALMAGPLSPTGSQWSDRKKEKLPAAVDLRPEVKSTCPRGRLESVGSVEMCGVEITGCCGPQACGQVDLGRRSESVGSVKMCEVNIFRPLKLGIKSLRGV